MQGAIESILRVVVNFQPIIKDDGSKMMDSVAIIERFVVSTKRIRFKKNLERLGLFQNYNACIKAATGKYIKLYAQDDLLEPDALQRMALVLEHSLRHRCACYGVIRIIDEEGQELERRKYSICRG